MPTRRSKIQHAESYSRRSKTQRNAILVAGHVTSADDTRPWSWAALSWVALGNVTQRGLRLSLSLGGERYRLEVGAVLQSRCCHVDNINSRSLPSPLHWTEARPEGRRKQWSVIKQSVWVLRAKLLLTLINTLQSRTFATKVYVLWRPLGPSLICTPSHFPSVSAPKYLYSM